MLQAIRFLQDQGLALAALSAQTLMLTDDGVVKIGTLPDAHAVGWWTDPSHSVGVEDSCQIPNEDMHADTLKLTALAVIVEHLMDHVAATMKKWNQPHSWGPEIRSFVQDLRMKPLDELLKVNSCAPSGHQLTFLNLAPGSISRLGGDREPRMAGNRR